MIESIDTRDPDRIRHLLREQLGQALHFSNGCWLSLKEDQGVFWGESPYGVVWGCNSGPGYPDRVLAWLNYWDAPRRENGEVCTETGL